MKTRESAVLAGFKFPGKISITGKKVRLREKRLSDVRNDYKWQSDPELARLDAASPLNLSFPIYLLEYTTEIRRSKANRYPLAIETLDGKHIGNCSCYDIDGKKGEAQFGIMIGESDYWNQGYGTDAVITMVDYVFSTTRLNRLYLKTLDWNVRAQKCFSNSGFVASENFSRNGYHFILMELTRERWETLPNRTLTMEKRD